MNLPPSTWGGGGGVGMGSVKGIINNRKMKTVAENILAKPITLELHILRETLKTHPVFHQVNQREIFTVLTPPHPSTLTIHIIYGHPHSL